MTSTPEQVIAKTREENAALTADRDAWIEAANAQMKRARAAEAERDALRKAMEPFAFAAKLYSREDDETSVLIGFEAGDRITLKVEDLRRARTLLAGDNHE